VLQISLTAMLLSFLATLYPSWQAARVQPAEALRHD
jgi:lipoprotein-releasing system permease protein